MASSSSHGYTQQENYRDGSGRLIQSHHSLNCVFPHQYTLISGFFKFSEKQPNVILPLPGAETTSSLDRALGMKDSELQYFHLGLSLALPIQIHLWEFSWAAEPKDLLRAHLETDPQMALNSDA